MVLSKNPLAVQERKGARKEALQPTSTLITATWQKEAKLEPLSEHTLRWAKVFTQEITLTS